LSAEFVVDGSSVLNRDGIIETILYTLPAARTCIGYLDRKPFDWRCDAIEMIDWEILEEACNTTAMAAETHTDKLACIFDTKKEVVDLGFAYVDGQVLGNPLVYMFVGFLS